MIARVLPPDEYSRLSVTGEPQMYPTVRPEDIEIWVVEDGEEIVGSLSVVRVPHLEGVWIAPDRRGSPTISTLLLRNAVESSRKWSKGWVMAQAADDHVKDLVSRCGGVKMPNVESYIMGTHG